MTKKYKDLNAKAVKVLPKIFRTENKALIQRMTDQLRRHLPKTFFTVTKRMMKSQKLGK